MNNYILNNIKGHHRIKEVLKRSLDNHRFPHAVLFTGPSGIGKRSLALSLASLLISNGQPNQATLSKVSRNIHTDLILMDTKWGIEKPTSSIKVEAIRKLETRINWGPHESNALVVIIDPADKLTSSSGNALLKTLEEPPSSVYFFLITESKENLLQTIRSRCQIFTFSPLENQDLTEILTDLYPDKDISIIKETVRFSEGSIQKASYLLNSDEYNPLEIANKIIQLASNGTLIQIFDFAEKLTNLNRDNSIIVLDIVKQNINAITQNQFDTNKKMRNFDFKSWFNLVNEASVSMKHNVNQKLTWEHLLWTMRKK